MGLLLVRLIIPVHRPGIILSSSLSQLVSSTSRFLGKIHDPIIFRRFVWEPKRLSKRYSVTLSHARLRLRIDRCQVGHWGSDLFLLCLLFGRGPSQGQQPASKSHRNVGALIFSGCFRTGNFFLKSPCPEASRSSSLLLSSRPPEICQNSP
jgi:hypothetical protein